MWLGMSEPPFEGLFLASLWLRCASSVAHGSPLRHALLCHVCGARLSIASCAVAPCLWRTALHCVMRSLPLQHAASSVVARGLSCSMACGILVP